MTKLSIESLIEGALSTVARDRAQALTDIHNQKPHFAPLMRAFTAVFQGNHRAQHYTARLGAIEGIALLYKLDNSILGDQHMSTLVTAATIDLDPHADDLVTDDRLTRETALRLIKDKCAEETGYCERLAPYFADAALDIQHPNSAAHARSAIATFTDCCPKNENMFYLKFWDAITDESSDGRERMFGIWGMQALMDCAQDRCVRAALKETVAPYLMNMVETDPSDNVRSTCLRGFSTIARLDATYAPRLIEVLDHTIENNGSMTDVFYSSQAARREIIAFTANTEQNGGGAPSSKAKQAPVPAY